MITFNSIATSFLLISLPYAVVRIVVASENFAISLVLLGGEPCALFVV